MPATLDRVLRGDYLRWSTQRTTGRSRAGLRELGILGLILAGRLWIMPLLPGHRRAAPGAGTVARGVYGWRTGGTVAPRRGGFMDVIEPAPLTGPATPRLDPGSPLVTAAVALLSRHTNDPVDSTC